MNFIGWAKAAYAIVKPIAIMNAPLIAIAAAGVGVAATAFIAWKQSKKASAVIAEKTKEKGAPLTKSEKLKATWKQILIVAVSVILTCGCGAASYYIHSVRLAEMTSMVNTLLASNKELMAEVDELMDIPEVAEKIAEKKEPFGIYTPRTLCSYEENQEPFMTGYGNELFEDCVQGIKYYSSYEHETSAIAQLYTLYEHSDDGVCLADYNKLRGVMKEGFDTLLLGWFKDNCLEVQSKPDIDVIWVPAMIEDPDSLEYEYCERGHWKVTYIPDGADQGLIADRLLSRAKKEPSTSKNARFWRSHIIEDRTDKEPEDAFANYSGI